MATQRLLDAARSGLLPLIQGAPVTESAVAPVQATQMPAQQEQPSSVYQNDFYGQQQQSGQQWYDMKPGGGKMVGETETPWYKDPNVYNSLALGFNTMRLNPDQGLAAALQDRIKTAQEMKVGSKTAQAVIAQLRNMGENDAADMVAAQPAIAKDVLTQIIQAKYAKAASPTASGVRVDPNSGQEYQVVFDPSTGKPKRVDVEGAFGETPSQKAGRESSERLKVFGMEKAAVTGQEIYKRASSLNESMTLLNRAKEVITKGGAQSGIIRSMLPAFDSATAELNEIASRLGINIINSATFGALSEKELGLALSTGLDRSLSGDELVKHIQDKISAQEKLYNQLMSDARLLTGGMTMNEYIQMRTSEPRKTPFPVYGGGVQLPPNLKSQMSEDEVAAFNKLPADMQQKFITGQ